jgi:hypothetical protein
LRKVTSFADAQQLLLSSRGGFSWHHADQGRELSAFSEGSSVSNRRDQCSRGDWTDTGNGKQSPAGLVLTGGALHAAIRFSDEIGELLQFMLQLYPS